MHFALDDDNAYITGADIQNSITMPHLAAIQLMCVNKWLRSDSDGRCVNKYVCGNKGFDSTYSNTEIENSGVLITIDGMSVKLQE